MWRSAPMSLSRRNWKEAEAQFGAISIAGLCWRWGKGQEAAQRCRGDCSEPSFFLLATLVAQNAANRNSPQSPPNREASWRHEGAQKANQKGHGRDSATLGNCRAKSRPRFESRRAHFFDRAGAESVYQACCMSHVRRTKM